MFATGGGRVSKPKGRQDHDVSDPLRVKNEQGNGRTTVLVILLVKNKRENGRTTILVILLKLKINRRMGGSRC